MCASAVGDAIGGEREIPSGLGILKVIC